MRDQQRMCVPYSAVAAARSRFQHLRQARHYVPRLDDSMPYSSRKPWIWLAWAVRLHTAILPCTVHLQDILLRHRLQAHEPHRGRGDARRSVRLFDVVLVRFPVPHHELRAHQPHHMSVARLQLPPGFALLHVSIATVQPLGSNAR